MKYFFNATTEYTVLFYAVCSVLCYVTQWRYEIQVPELFSKP